MIAHNIDEYAIIAVSDRTVGLWRIRSGAGVWRGMSGDVWEKRSRFQTDLKAA